MNEKKANRVLVIAGLGNNMLDCFLSPILNSGNVSIHVMRSFPGISRKGVTYHCPPGILRENAILSFIWKVFHTLLLGIGGRFSCVYAIYAYPHLYIGSLFSLITRTPLVYSVIASWYEFKMMGRIPEIFTEKLSRRALFVSVSNDRAREYVNRIGVENDRIVFFRNLDLINLDNFCPLNLTKSMHLIVVSGFRIDKHIDKFIKIISVVKQSFPGIKSIIVGDGSEKDNLEDIVRRHDLSDNIVFAGFVKSQINLNKILNTAKIFVLNSSREGGPFTVIEAMAAGLCCVANRVGEVPELIEHGTNGYIMKRYDDIEEYANRILMLLRNDQHLQGIQDAASLIKLKQNSNSVIHFWKKIFTKL